MRAIVATLAVLSCASGVGAAEDTAWYKWVNKDYGIAAMFPGKATVAKQDDGVQASLEQKGTGAYMVQVNKLENELDVTDEKVVKKVFDGAQAGLLNGLAGAKLASAEDFEYDEGVAARDIDLSLGQDAAYRVLLLLDGKQLYQIAIVGKTSFAEADDAEAFRQSFRFLHE